MRRLPKIKYPVIALLSLSPPLSESRDAWMGLTKASDPAFPSSQNLLQSRTVGSLSIGEVVYTGLFCRAEPFQCGVENPVLNHGTWQRRGQSGRVCESGLKSKRPMTGGCGPTTVLVQDVARRVRA